MPRGVRHLMSHKKSGANLQSENTMTSSGTIEAVAIGGFLIGFACGVIIVVIWRTKHYWIGVMAAFLVVFFCLVGTHFMGLYTAGLMLIVFLFILLIVAITATERST
jgi:hypothetical protein